MLPIAAPGDAIVFLSLIPTAATHEKWLCGGHSVRHNSVFIETLCATDFLSLGIDEESEAWGQFTICSRLHING